MKKISFLFIIVMAILFSQPLVSQVNITDEKNTVLQNHTDKAITVFIHGTFFRAFSWLWHYFDCPYGFSPITKINKKIVITRIPYTLFEADNNMFPLETFYLFGWNGYLCFDDRKEAARNLYAALKNHKGPITIIGHSHGCNVALNLALCAQEDNNKTFKIDRLILLAGPVQEVTKKYITSPIFKRIYSLYSLADFTQILDPQKLYKKTRELYKEANFFSERTFPADRKLIQARIKFNRKSPSHLDFMIGRILRHLPTIITILDKQFELDQETFNKHYTISIIKKRDITSYKLNN